MSDIRLKVFIFDDRDEFFEGIFISGIIKGMFFEVFYVSVLSKDFR